MCSVVFHLSQRCRVTLKRCQSTGPSTSGLELKLQRWPWEQRDHRLPPCSNVHPSEYLPSKTVHRKDVVILCAPPNIKTTFFLPNWILTQFQSRGCYSRTSRSWPENINWSRMIMQLILPAYPSSEGLMRAAPLLQTPEKRSDTRIRF